MDNTCKIVTVLNQLINNHSQCIKNNFQNNVSKVSFVNNEFEDISKLLNVKWSKDIEPMNSRELENEIKILNQNRRPLLNSINNILFVKDNFNPLHRIVPNVYDLLMVIFQKTSTTERSQHFHYWVSYYYNNLTKKLKQNGFNVEHILPKPTYDNLLKKFLPYVKIDTVADKNTENEEFNVLILEIIEYIRYPKILREDCYAIMNKILNSVPYKLLHFELVPILDSAGTLGEYYTLKLSIEHSGKNENFRFFSKYLPSNNRTNEDQKKLARDIFHKEVFFYTKFIPKVIELGFGEITNFAPKFYFGRDDDVLVLEDLSVFGYKMSDIREPGSFEWLLPIIKNLAKMHACSILLEEKLSKDNGNIFRIGQEYGENLIETLVVKDNILTENSMKTVVNYLIDKFSEIPKKFSVEEFKRKARIKLDLIYKMVQKSTKYRNVICHGDMWASNILYKEDASSKSISSYIIDFQLVKYCLPTYDLMEVIYTNTSKEIREQHKAQLLEIYYSDLTEILNRYGVDINDIFDRQTFDICCELLKSTGIGMGVHLVQTFVTPDHISFLQTEEQDIKTEFLAGDRSKFLEKAIYDEPLRSRVKDLITDLYYVCAED